MFVLGFALLQVAILVLSVQGRLDWLMNANAVVTAAIVGLLDIPVTLQGTQLVMTNHILQIDLECTGITIAALYAALIVAYPLSIRTRLLALAVGLPVLAIVNVVRLVGVALASEYLSPDLFFFAHDYLFRVVMILAVVALWVAWLQVARTHASHA